MRPIERQQEQTSEIDEALAWHDGDPRAAIATLLADCAYLRWQLELSRRSVGFCFTRGWQPQLDRD